MDGANVEIVQEVGEENAVIFGLSSDEVIHYENEGGYDPMEVFNNDQDVRKVLMQLINGEYCRENPELFIELYNSLLYNAGGRRAEAHRKMLEKYKDEKGWAKSAMLNVACSGKFSSDRTIEEYVKDIWKLEKVTVKL